MPEKPLLILLIMITPLSMTLDTMELQSIVLSIMLTGLLSSNHWGGVEQKGGAAKLLNLHGSRLDPLPK